MESEKKVGFFSKCWNVVKGVKTFVVNVIKVLFGTWGRATKTISIGLVLVIAEYYIPGVAIFGLCALGAVMAIMYFATRFMIAVTASMEGITVAEAELKGNPELSILR